MAKAKQEFLLTGIELNKSSNVSLYQQLYEALRKAILGQQLRPGQALPPSRELAKIFNISRSTVLLALDHLHTEGYITGKTGAGTFVSNHIPDDFFQVESEHIVETQEVDNTSELNLSIIGNRIQKRLNPVWLRSRGVMPFQPGIPALREFPFELWAKLMGKATRNLPTSAFGYQSIAGYLPLREAIADYLRRSRMVRCEAEQVLIISGSQQGLDLIARLILDPNDKVWVEDPGYSGAKQALWGAGAELVPVPIDEEGLCVAEGRKLCSHAKLAYVTPSHQYPLGIHMSLGRRIELLEWAKEEGSWIIEDDYDSEYRYVGRPLSSLQGIDQHGRVFYVGTFSKVLFPALRLGYLVVPPQWVDAFLAAKAMIDRSCSLIPQVALTEFMEKGHFGRHIRRMRLLYEARQQCLIETIQTKLDGMMSIQHAQAGLHLTADFRSGIDVGALTEKVLAQEISIPPVSDYCLKANISQRVIMGYAAYKEEEIIEAIDRLGGML